MVRSSTLNSLSSKMKKHMFQDKTDRQQLADDIVALEPRAQAEADFAALFEGEKNPWLGSATQLKEAKEQLAVLDERIRRDAFGRLLVRYEDACERLRVALTYRDRIREIEKEQHASGGYEALRLGAELRNGPATSEKDAAQRAAAEQWRKLEQERSALSLAIQNPRETRQHLEREYPFLVALGAQLDAKLVDEPIASAA
jgi:hypothetical protein